MKKMLASSLMVSFFALILVVTWGSAVRAANGKVVYDLRCAPCHGATGRGDGRAAALFQPKPQNFTDPAFWQGNVDQKILKNVMGFGIKMGKMDLSPDEITAVTAYITQQFKGEAQEHPGMMHGGGAGQRHMMGPGMMGSGCMMNNMGMMSNMMGDMRQLMGSQRMTPELQQQMMEMMGQMGQIMQQMQGPMSPQIEQQQTQQLQEMQQRLQQMKGQMR